MKSITLILVLCVACSQSPLARKMSDREHDGFSGPVKKVFVTWSPVYGYEQIPADARCRQMTNVYDQAGRLMQHSVYPGTCGSDEVREDYSYLPDGARTTKTQEMREKERLPPAAARSGTEAGNGELRATFKYDLAGRLIEMASVTTQGKVVDKYTYSYDSKGRMIEMSGYEDGNVSNRRVYSYSGDAQVPSEFVYYGRDGSIYERTAYTNYEFNARGDWVRRTETTEETFNRKSGSLTFREIEYYPDTK